MAADLDAPVFLLTCGRTGSTLLQRLLNVHESLHIWGEHGGALSGLRTAHKMATAPSVSSLIGQTPADCREKVLASEPVVETGSWSIQWYNGFGDSDVDEACRGFMRQLFAKGIKPTARHWGFKEIRYGLQDAIFFKQLFEKAKFLVLVRDPSVVLRSQLEYFYINNVMNVGGIDEQKLTNQSLQALKSVERVADLLGSDFAADCCEVRYEELISDPRAVMATIATALGVEPFPEDRFAVIVGEPRQGNAAQTDEIGYIKSWIGKERAEQSAVGIALDGTRQRLGYS